MRDKIGPHFWARWLLAAVLLLFLWSGVLEARAVAYHEAWLAAARLLEMENSRPDLRLTKGTFWLDGLEPLVYQDQPVAFLAKLKPQGFMILSDITEVSPQVFICFSGDYDSIRTHSLLTATIDYLAYCQVRLGPMGGRASSAENRVPLAASDLVLVQRNEILWSSLLSLSSSSIGSLAALPSSDEVPPMLTCHWDQGYPYNDYAPYLDSGAKPPAGCSAIAMAQVMYYWKYPERGQGSYSYPWHGQTLSADFNHPYYWDRMLDTYSGSCTGLQIDAVARLVSDVGISIAMDYEHGSSGASMNPAAFVQYFKYCPSAHLVHRYSFADWAAWFEMLKQQMDLRQPVAMSVFGTSSGHSLVVDGYRTSPANQIHVNLGWGEGYDCYSNVENIMGWDAGGYFTAIIDIRPKLKLTIQASAGGTTDPAPGVYEYDYAPGLVVRVTAFPDLYFRFLGWWLGESNYQENPFDIALNKVLTITARFERIIYAPSNAAGQRVVNRSLSQAENINVLTFAPNPDNVDIVNYRIYTVDGGQRTELTTLDANTFKYLHRGVSKNKSYTYEIVAVNGEPREGAPAVIIIQ